MGADSRRLLPPNRRSNAAQPPPPPLAGAAAPKRGRMPLRGPLPPKPGLRGAAKARPLLPLLLLAVRPKLGVVSSWCCGELAVGGRLAAPPRAPAAARLPAAPAAELALLALLRSRLVDASSGSESMGVCPAWCAPRLLPPVLDVGEARLCCIARTGPGDR